MLFTQHIKNSFAQIGARVMVEPAREMWRELQAVRLEVRVDQRGSRFHLMGDPLRVLSVEAIDVQPDLRHLLLKVRQRAFGRINEAPAQVFLCGHNGLSWYIEAVSNSVRSVRDARREVLAEQLLDSARQAQAICDSGSRKGGLPCSLPSPRFAQARSSRSPARASDSRPAHSPRPRTLRPATPQGPARRI